MNPTTSKLYDRNEVARAVTVLLDPGQVTELRALDAATANERWPATLRGYFDDTAKLVEALDEIKSAMGIYIVANPVDPALLARAANRIRKAGKGESTSDNDILARRWLLIDCDPRRPAGISATDEEHEAAILRCRDIYMALRHNYGWPDPIAADSGNGGHLLYRVNLPRHDDGLVEKCLATLATQFDDEAVKIDTTVFNPARIWKLYGTLACKGDNTPDRPHRMSRIISAPDPILTVNRALLEMLAAEAAAAEPVRHETNGHRNGQPFDIDSFIAQNGFDMDGPDAYQGGRRWTFRKSPMCEHHDDGPYLIQFASGALAAGCHHNSCNWSWPDLRARCAPQQPVKFTSGPPALPASRMIEPYKPFPVDVLPAVIAKYVSAAAMAIGCDPAFIALPLLGCLARAIGSSRVIRLKQGGRPWDEFAIVWAAIIGKSGTHKTPAIQAALYHMQRKQSTAMADYQEALAEYEDNCALYERDYSAWKRLKSNQSEPPPQRPAEPVCTRFITVDTTIEALAAILNKQYDGILVTRDELAGWLGGIAEYKGGKGSDLGHWLACWSGVPMTVDRKTGAVKMIHVERAAVSLVGGIQPGVLKLAVGREHMQDGLCARLLLAMPAPRTVRWTESTVEKAADEALDHVIDRLLTLRPIDDEHGFPIPLAMPLSDGAKRIWVEYFNRHRAELTELEDDLAAAWSKLEAYTARFALIFQLCSWAGGDADASEQVIDEAAMRSAIALSDWFGGEARRVYALFAESTVGREQRELIELIRRKGGEVTARELMRSSRRFSSADEAETALDSLLTAGLGRWVARPSGPKGGKPTRTFALVDSVDIDETAKKAKYGEVLSTSTIRNGHDHDAIKRFSEFEAERVDVAQAGERDPPF